MSFVRRDCLSFDGTGADFANKRKLRIRATPQMVLEEETRRNLRVRVPWETCLLAVVRCYVLVHVAVCMFSLPGGILYNIIANDFVF